MYRCEVTHTMTHTTNNAQDGNQTAENQKQFSISTTVEKYNEKLREYGADPDEFYQERSPDTEVKVFRHGMDEVRDDPDLSTTDSEGFVPIGEGLKPRDFPEEMAEELAEQTWLSKREAEAHIHTRFLDLSREEAAYQMGIDVDDLNRKLNRASEMNQKSKRTITLYEGADW